MKKFSLFLMLTMAFFLSQRVYADDVKTMKISYNGEVKQAKEIGEGKGINITLPELDDENFYINAIEIAVFERKENESQWHIYKDDDGEESKKKYIESPDGLNVQVDFGNVADYREKAKYKLAYRYYVQSVDDMSNILIAGSDSKDGWRIVGEINPLRATDDGFVFYTNSNPTIDVISFSYDMHTAEGDESVKCSPEDLDNIRLPNDAFLNGITVDYSAYDFDNEDELTVKYQLIDAFTENIIASGYLEQEPVICADVTSDTVKLKLTVSDNYSGQCETEWYVFGIDTQAPFVASEFDDFGFMLSGKNLFSDFTVYDDSGMLMNDGSVYAKVFLGDDLYMNGYLEYINDGIYRLDENVNADGEYKVELYIYDKAGNEGHHIFYQTLDNTKPTAEFISDEINPEATKYYTWMNLSKKIIVDVGDNLSGVKKYTMYLNNLTDKHVTLETSVNQYTIINPVTNEMTGKLVYRGYIFDDAKVVDRDNNRADINSNGNRLTFIKQIWLDKTPPVIECDADETVWYESPAVFEIDFIDEPSGVSVDDASGINIKQYAVTDSEMLPSEWNTFNGSVTVNSGGVFFIHLRAVDNAGNESTLTKKVHTNAVCTILGSVQPTDDYMHTIYHSEPAFYVVKTTAYNTKYHFLLSDADVEDSIKVNARLISQDNHEIYASTSSVTYPDGNIERDIVFNMPYVDDAGEKLPDGVYDMYIDISEIKNDGEVILTHQNLNVCEVVIKRTAPPTPVINVNSGMVEIEYPDEPLSASLNSIFVKSKYKRQYKIVKNGHELSGYADYTDSFPVDDITVIALYTDIAGNTSVSTKRIFKSEEGGPGGTDIDPTVEGSNTSVEESRAGNVYYIGTRREKQKGINSDIFNFIN